MDFTHQCEHSRIYRFGREDDQKIYIASADFMTRNTTRRVAKTLYNNTNDVEIYGFLDGYKGMITKNYKLMKEEDFSGILTEGGTILGTSRTPFKYINEPDEKGRDKVAGMIKTYKDLKLDCLVMLGGNGSHKTAALLSQKGLNVVTLPKTIDNDIEGTEMSFGFQSAIDVATRTIDEIHTTAASHSRVFIVEIMGHKTGWLTLHSGIAGGADIILIPEIPYNVDEVLNTIRKREKQGKKFTIIAMAEGAISDEVAGKTKMVNADNELIRQAESLGISLGRKA